MQPHALVPAALGVLVGAAFTYQAWRDVAAPDARERAKPFVLLMLALPASALALAALVTFLADASTTDLAFPLLGVGAAGLVQGIAQGVLARQAVPRLAVAPDELARWLPRFMAAEIVTVLAVVYFFTRLGT